MKYFIRGVYWWKRGEKHRLFMFPLSKRSKKHTRVNYHDWVIVEKGCDGSDPSCHWVAQSKVLVKRSTKDFNLEMCIWKNLSKSRVHTGSREPIILGEILPLCKTIEANISDGGAIDRGSRKKVPNIKVSIYFPLWSRCKCLKTIMGNIKRALTITKKGYDQVWWKKEKKTPLHSRFTALHTRPRN